MSMVELEQAARIAAIAAGIIFGAVAISSASWVWLKRQIFAYGGSVLSVAGIVLMGLSIYKTVDVKAAPDGLQLKLAEISEELKTTNKLAASTHVDQAALSAITKTVAELKDGYKRQSERYDDVLKTLNAQPIEMNARLAGLEETIKKQGEQQIARLKSVEGELAGKMQIVGGWNAGLSNYMVGYDPSKYSSAGLVPYTGVYDWSDRGLFGAAPDIASLEAKVSEYRKKLGANQKSHELSDALIALGDAYGAAGRKSEAEVAYQQALKARS